MCCVQPYPLPAAKPKLCSCYIPSPPLLSPSRSNVTPLPPRLREHPRFAERVHNGERWQGPWVVGPTFDVRSRAGRRNHHLKITHNWHIGMAPTCWHRGASALQNVFNLLVKQTITDGNTVLIFCGTTLK